MTLKLIQRHAVVGVEHQQLRDEMRGGLADEVGQRVLHTHDFTVSPVVFVVVERRRADEDCKIKNY